MSILIKGMETPINCRTCLFSGYVGRGLELNVCTFTGEHQLASSPERMSGCPLIELPPHGDLIDRDALPIHGLSRRGGEWLMYTEADEIMNAPAIIPAEEAAP